MSLQRSCREQELWEVAFWLSDDLERLPCFPSSWARVEEVDARGIRVRRAVPMEMLRGEVADRAGRRFWGKGPKVRQDDAERRDKSSNVIRYSSRCKIVKR